MIERFGQFLEFFERIDSPWVGLNFDIGHAFCVGEEPQDWVAQWPRTPGTTTSRISPPRGCTAI